MFRLVPFHSLYFHTAARILFSGADGLALPVEESHAVQPPLLQSLLAEHISKL